MDLNHRNNGFAIHAIRPLWHPTVFRYYNVLFFCNHSLSQVVNRDCIKIQGFENIGWEVKIYQDNQWTPEEAMIDILGTVRHLL